MSVWDDSSSAKMLWLDGTYPENKPITPGMERGHCDAASGDSKALRKLPKNLDAWVEFSDIRVGDIGTTVTDTNKNPKPTSPAGPVGPSPVDPVDPTPVDPSVPGGNKDFFCSWNDCAKHKVEGGDWCNASRERCTGCGGHVCEAAQPKPVDPVKPTPVDPVKPTPVDPVTPVTPSKKTEGADSFGDCSCSAKCKNATDACIPFSPAKNGAKAALCLPVLSEKNQKDVLAADKLQECGLVSNKPFLMS